jgi:hypothetical protein
MLCPPRVGRPFHLITKKKLPRRRNLWVTETFERRLEARLAQSANPMPEYSGLGVCVRSQLALEPGFPPR